MDFPFKAIVLTFIQFIPYRVMSAVGKWLTTQQEKYIISSSVKPTISWLCLTSFHSAFYFDLERAFPKGDDTFLGFRKAINIVVSNFHFLINKRPTQFERVSTAKAFSLIILIISRDSKWTNHVETIASKAGKHLYLLRQLERANVSHIREQSTRRTFPKLVSDAICCVVYFSMTWFQFRQQSGASTNTKSKAP